jgi:MOSC domain-containing protein YiiM
MVAKAAVKIDLYSSFHPFGTEPDYVIIPCHRHADAYEILNIFHCRNGKEYEVIAEGFLDENDNFMTRAEAWQEANRCHQFTDAYIEEHIGEENLIEVLYSEDVW